MKTLILIVRKIVLPFICLFCLFAPAIFSGMDEVLSGAQTFMLLLADLAVFFLSGLGAGVIELKRQ